MLTIKRTYNTKYKLPTVNWIPIKPNQVKGTIFNEFHNEDIILKTIDFSDFEEQFKLGEKLELSRKYSNPVISGSKKFKTSEKVSLLEHNRLRNMAISLRKVDIDIETVMRAINSFDIDTLTLEYIEILLRMIPNPQEVQAYREYEKSGRSVDLMTDEDKFLFQISKIERLEQKLKIMFYIETLLKSEPASQFDKKSDSCQNVVQECKHKIATITEASNILKKSKGIRIALEYILVFGNYLNCSTRAMANAPTYGFKLQTLEIVTEIKSTLDRSRSLLHYVVDVIKKNLEGENGLSEEERLCKLLATLSPTTAFKKFSSPSSLLSGLDISLESIKLPYDLEKLITALDNITVSLENCTSEVSELEKGMELVKKELQLRIAQKDNATLRLQNFVSSRNPDLINLKEDLKQAQLSYNDCIEYFGENVKNLESSSQFFNTFAKFLKQYKQCLRDNKLVEKKKLEALLQEKLQQAAQNKLSEQEVSQEVKVKEKRILKQDEVYNGALEDILLGLF